MVLTLKPTLKPILNLSILTDEELLYLLCTTEEDSHLYEEFVNRFYNDIHLECQLLCTKRKIDPHIGTEIAANTFERFRKYKSFKPVEGHSAQIRKSILVYLFRFVRNQFNDYHTKSKKENVFHETYLEKIGNTFQNNINLTELLNKRELTERILKRLNAKEKRVLITDMEYKRHKKYLPDEVLDELANELGIKKDTVRKIRERAINKLKQAIDEINKS